MEERLPPGSADHMGDHLDARIRRPSRRPPNLLLLFSDEHNARMAGFAGSTTVRTPHLDRLAAQGVVFDDAICNAPLCSPSRQSFMAGLHAHRIEMWNNTASMPEDTVTWAHMLSAAGYETSLLGKMHFNGYQRMYGFDRRPVLEGNAAGEEFYSWGVRTSHDWTAPLDSSEGPGHGMWEELTGASADRPEREPIFRHDFKIFDAARRELEAKAADPRGQPWAMCVSFVLPHPPWKARADLLERYRGTGDLPFDREGVDRDACDRSIQRYVGGIARLPDAVIRHAREVYWALIEEADEHVGRIMATLAATGLDRDTVVVYVSDHGEMAGEHGLWGKVTLLESALRVPLIISWPGRFPGGKRVAAPVSLVDLFPTFLDLAGTGLPSPLTVDGRSLLPLILGDGADFAGRTVLAEIEGEGWNHPRACLRDGRWKYVHNHTADARLYDLAADPGEMRDLSAGAEHAPVLRRMRDALLAEWDPIAIERRVLAAQRRRMIARNRNPCKDLGW